MKKVLKFQLDGIPFVAKIIETGDRYGLNGCLKHNQEEPLVEFYDGRSTFDEPEGQFISHYYVSTLLERPFGDPRGLLLDTGSKDWVLSISEIQLVSFWLRQYLMQK